MPVLNLEAYLSFIFEVILFSIGVNKNEESVKMLLTYRNE